MPIRVPAKKLLQNSSDPYFKAIQIYWALYFAVRKNYLKIVDTILNYPGNINCKGVMGRTPLHLSAGFGHLQISRILMDRGANHLATDQKQQLPLHYACLHKHFDIAYLLLKRDLSSINHQDSRPVWNNSSHVGC